MLLFKTCQFITPGKIDNSEVQINMLFFTTCQFTWKNRQQYKNNKLQKITPTWNDEIKLLDGSYSVSDIQD